MKFLMFLTLFLVIMLTIVIVVSNCDRVVTPEQHDQCIAAANQKASEEFERLGPDQEYIDCIEGPAIERRYNLAVQRCFE